MQKCFFVENYTRPYVDWPNTTSPTKKQDQNSSTCEDDTLIGIMFLESNEYPHYHLITVHFKLTLCRFIDGGTLVKVPICLKQQRMLDIDIDADVSSFFADIDIFDLLRAHW